MKPLSLLAAFLLAVSVLAEPPTTQPLTQVHAHNDYVHPRPLFDALDHGFCSVEADIHLINGQLLVAHSLLEIKSDRTLQSLYLNPLRDRIKHNNGRVYKDGPTVVLLIDIKTPFAQTYPELKKVLQEYKDLLTTWTDGQRRDGALLAIITGYREQATIAADNPRHCACDGLLSDLDTNPSPELVPWISAEWKKSFSWKAKGEGMPEQERQKLRDITSKAHAQHRQIRWWSAPDNVACWTELRAAGVDLINTDDLAGTAAFLLCEKN